MGYVKKTVLYAQVAWVGDALKDLRMHVYADADFAGCQSTNRCTSGMFLTIEGPKTSYPIGANCKKQHHTCYSTVEAEAVAGCFALRTAGIPGMVLWNQIMELYYRKGNAVSESVA